MRYILYLFTLALMFVGGMMVGNIYLPEHNATLASAVAVPPLSQTNPALQEVSREQTERNLTVLGQALESCPAVVNEEKDRLLNQIRLLLAVQNFELKKANLQFEIAKNKEDTRPTSQFIQAHADYNTARLAAENLAEELFPLPTEEKEEGASAAEQNRAQPTGKEAVLPSKTADKK